MPPKSALGCHNPHYLNKKKSITHFSLHFHKHFKHFLMVYKKLLTLCMWRHMNDLHVHLMPMYLTIEAARDSYA